MRRYCNYCGCDQEFEVYDGEKIAVLRENSHAELWGNSHAVLSENSHAVLRENSHAQCKSPYACGILKSLTSKCSGRHIGDKPLSPEKYLAYCGVDVVDDVALLYKSVNPDFSSIHDPSVIYTIGKEVVAPDWDGSFRDECGKGLHLSPSIQQARSFHDAGTYLACQVRISDIASLPANAEYPDKIRVRACTPLYLVDKEGNKLNEAKPIKTVLRDTNGRFMKAEGKQ